MNSQAVLRQPRGPPVEGESPWRTTTTSEGMTNGSSNGDMEQERKTSVSSEYGADSSNPDNSLSLGDDGLDAAEDHVYVTYIESPNTVWVQGADSTNEEEIKQLTTKLQVFCSNRPLLQKAPIANKIYGGVYVGDEQWYRCKVLQIVSSEEVKVHFIDFGNTEVLQQFQIVQLSSELYNYNAFAKLYKLKGVADVNDCLSAQFLKGTELLSQLVMEKQLTVKNKSQINNTSACLVDMIYQENNQEIDVNQKMRTNGFVTPVSPKVQVKTTKRHAVEEVSSAKHPLNVNEGDRKKIQELEKLSKGQNKTIETLKQLCSQLERSRKVELEDARNKLNECLNNAVSKKVNQVLSCITHVRKIRKDCKANGDDALKVVLDSKQLLQSKERMELDNMQELVKVKELECKHENLNKTIRQCSDKSLLSGLVTERNQSRQELHECIGAFIEQVKNMGLDLAKVQLEVAQSSLHLHSNNTESPLIEQSQTEAREHMFDVVKQYEAYMVKKEESLREMYELVNQKCKTLSDVHRYVIKSLNLEEDVSDDENTSVSDLDDMMVVLEALIQEETAKSKCSDTEVELRNQAVSLLLGEITKQLNSINELRDGLLEHYTALQVKLQECKDTKPDMETAILNKKKIRGLKSKLRHKLVDKQDLKETEEDYSEVDSNKLEEELSNLYSELHWAFVEERAIINNLANLTREQFPELSLQYPEQGITQWMETNGLVMNTREAEHYPLEETTEPGVFMSRFCDSKCYIKEYFFRDSATKEDFQTRVLRFHNCIHDRLMHLDALFYSKNGRSGYLQVPYYESLEDWLQTTPSSQAIMAVVKDTLEALRALHAHAIVHGQVDSSNVFVLKKDGDGLARGILGLYDFSEKWEQRMAVTSSKIDGLPEDTPKCAKFDVMCLGQLLKSISHLNVLNEDADLQSLLDSLLPAHTTCVPTIQQVLDMPFFHKVNGPVEDELD